MLYQLLSMVLRMVGAWTGATEQPRCLVKVQTDHGEHLMWIPLE